MENAKLLAHNVTFFDISVRCICAVSNIEIRVSMYEHLTLHKYSLRATYLFALALPGVYNTYGSEKIS